MINVPDLTLEQIKAQCSNSVVYNYITSMPELPKEVTMASLLGSLMQAATQAQNLANFNHRTTQHKGELATYWVDSTKKIEEDVIGRQFFYSTYKLSLRVYINHDVPMKCINI